MICVHDASAMIDVTFMFVVRLLFSCSHESSRNRGRLCVKDSGRSVAAVRECIRGMGHKICTVVLHTTTVSATGKMCRNFVSHNVCLLFHA